MPLLIQVGHAQADNEADQSEEESDEKPADRAAALGVGDAGAADGEGEKNDPGHDRVEV